MREDLPDDGSVGDEGEIHAALRELESRVARLLDVALPEFDEACALYATGLISAPECASSFLSSELPGWLELLHETVRVRLHAAIDIRAPEYLATLARRQELIASARPGMEQADLFVVPTVPITAPTLAQIEALEDHCA